MELSELEKYRAIVVENIKAITSSLARISYGDFAHRLDVDKIEDNEFAEIICGLELLKDDLVDAHREANQQNRLNQMRTEIWKCATKGHLTQKELIQDLLDIVGPYMDVGRASYYHVDHVAQNVSIVCQWNKPSLGSTIGLALPERMLEQLVGKRFVELDAEELVRKGHAQVADLMHEHGVGSMLGIVNGSLARPFGYFAFSTPEAGRRWTELEKNTLSELVNIISTKIAQIAAEEALRVTNLKLEEDVASRTAELDRMNRELQADIEQRKRAEKGLRESEEKFRSLAEKLPNMVFINQGGRVVYANERVEEVMGYPRSFFYSETFDLASIIAPEVWPDVQAQMRRHMLGQEIPPYEYTLIAKDGRRIHAIHATRLLTYGGEKAILGIITDITDKKKLEDELIRASKLESIGVLAGGIAHDFNNILTGIITNMFMAKMNVKDNAETYQLLSEAEKAAYRASKLTKQLLTFSKGGAPVKEVTSIKDIIEDAVGFCLSGSKVDYTLDIPNDLDPVEVDKGQIDQVLNNLIINADQAMPGGGTINVVVRMIDVTRDMKLPLKRGRYVKVSILDTGIGIPPEAASKVFDPYFTTKATGTGLGLTTAYSIVQKHNGYLCFDSIQGKGTTFSFYLPASGMSMSELEETRRVEIPRGSGRVLIMDDDEVVRTVMERLLKASGYEPTSVGNGAAAIAAYKNARESGKPFEVVIMDLTIQGGKGGKETGGELLAIDPATKIIVVSGYSNDPVMSNYRDYGFKGVVSKPFTIEEFTGVINGVVKG
jgi:PAS domain S-box-containing protein